LVPVPSVVWCKYFFFVKILFLELRQKDPVKLVLFCFCFFFVSFFCFHSKNMFLIFLGFPQVTCFFVGAIALGCFLGVHTLVNK
jgi:hypothetical protein